MCRSCQIKHLFHSVKQSALQYIFGTMLSEIIKKKIENKSGLRVRYVRDCNALAEKISTECSCRISGSTMRRLFGLGGGNGEPRAYTLDIIALYIGYRDWDDLLASFNTTVQSDKFMNELKPAKLKSGEKFELSYRPDTVITIEYTGKYRFKVLSAKNSRLKTGDVFKVSVITLHYPLFILDVEGSKSEEGRMIEGKISGVTSIRKL
jgi:hypothetical protein